MTNTFCQTWGDGKYYDWVRVSPRDSFYQPDEGPYIHLDECITGEGGISEPSRPHADGNISEGQDDRDGVRRVDPET